MDELLVSGAYVVASPQPAEVLAFRGQLFDHLHQERVTAERSRLGVQMGHIRHGLLLPPRVTRLGVEEGEADEVIVVRKPLEESGGHLVHGKDVQPAVHHEGRNVRRRPTGGNRPVRES
nr:hypothetical protein [Microbispora oryzae]